MFRLVGFSYISVCAVGHGVFAVDFYTEIQNIFVRASHAISHPGNFVMQSSYLCCNFVTSVNCPEFKSHAVAYASS